MSSLQWRSARHFLATYILTRNILPSPAPYVFSVFTVSVAISKIVRLAAYVQLVPLASFVLFFPTFWVHDITIVCIVRLLLWQQARSLLAYLAFSAALLITIFTNFGAASQIGFFIKTGTELDWSDAPAFVTNWNSFVVLLSGAWRVLGVASFIWTIAYFLNQPLYRAFGALNNYIGALISNAAKRLQRLAKRSGASTRKSTGDDSEAAKLLLEEENHWDNRDVRRESNDTEPCDYRDKGALGCCVSSAFWLAVKIVLLVFLLAGYVFRPNRPYLHMSTSLPEQLAVVFKSTPTYCSEQHKILDNEWPFPELVDKSRWKNPKGNFKGWAPGAHSELVEKYRKWSPSWIPDRIPRGFFRWDPRRFDRDNDPRGHPPPHHPPCSELPLYEAAYNPVNDPLRITNLDEDILEPIKEALDNGSVKIKHVVYILMESLRSEFFPLQQGSDIHQAILALSPDEEQAMVNERLAQLTPHIERITGVKGGFTDEFGLPYPAPKLTWNDKTDDNYGGINVIGSYTAATMSTKSFAVNHCGAWAMPVETFEEAATDSYQPCMPQILNFWSDLKGEESSTDDFRQLKWNPALFESMVETYDRQDIFDRKIGFKQILTREQLEQLPDFDKSDPKYKEVNYFSYSEQVLKPHIREYINNTLENNQRIWMSHFTSTTHHPWTTPDGFNTTDYMPTGFLSRHHQNFNRYINAMRYNDAWMAELMGVLEETGIANETLVVFAGDHGMAFYEDDGVEGTYSNAHVSNFRVPITFHHPRLPRVQYRANATTMSTLPTILDLLINSGSLNEDDTEIASDLVHEYEGQSLLRPYKTSEDGRRAWNFVVNNSGGKMLTVTSADAPWLLIVPFSKVFPYRFADIGSDPLELDPVIAWTIDDVMRSAGTKYGEEAAAWAEEAELVAKWWSTERKRLWRYRSGGPPPGPRGRPHPRPPGHHGPPGHPGYPGPPRPPAPPPRTPPHW